MKGSYQLESFTENREAEVLRLKFQVDLFYPQEFELLKKLGLKDGMELIECGCGPGYLIRRIIDDLPSTKAHALEIDPFLFEHLKENSHHGNEKLFEVRQGSIYETGYPDNWFDFAIARLVLEHLEDPIKALVEVRRILKPGGRFVIISNDFDYHLVTYPAIQELNEMYAAYIRSRFSEGGNPLIGRQLPVLLQKCGFDQISFDIVGAHSTIEGDQAFLRAENINISKSLVKEGFLGQEILDSLVLNWYSMLKDPNHIIYRQLFVSSGVKADIQNAVEPEKAEQHSQIAEKPFLETLFHFEQEEQTRLLSEYLLKHFIKFIDKAGLEINPAVRLVDYDIDSIAAAEIAAFIKAEFNTKIPISDILQKYSLLDIRQCIQDTLISNKTIKEKAGRKEDGMDWLEGEL